LSTLVVRSNYGDESIALIQYLCSQEKHNFDQVYVVYIDTGWSAQGWQERVELGEQYVQSIGFEVVRLKAEAGFEDLVLDRKNFPSKKFQWCAGFLKGIPLINWLDAHDEQGDWVVAIAKRQALYRKPVPEYIEECEFHGERKVWHPMLHIDHQQTLKYIKSAGFKPIFTTSQECAPCIHSTEQNLATLAPHDINKTQKLEQVIDKPMFATRFISEKVVQAKLSFKSAPKNFNMDAFSMGCGDPFGCGL